MTGITVWLESYAGLIAVCAPLAVVVNTILVGETTMREALPGYADYMKRVRYRLVPFVW